MLIDHVTEALKTLEELRRKSLDEIASDRILLSATLWNLYIAVQGCIDISLKIISRLGLRTPESYADAFNVLSEEKIIPPDLAKILASMAKFRHIIAHAYTKIDVKKVYDLINYNLEDLKEFLRSVAHSLEKSGIDIKEF
ncbi:MAG: DUF86 domain-containing protein [Candidatus Jordarchaeales archaeon]